MNGGSQGVPGHYRVSRDDTFLRDQIHLTEMGGEVVAKYFRSRLQNYYPRD